MLAEWIEIFAERPGNWLVLGAVAVAGTAAKQVWRPVAKAAIKRFLAVRDQVQRPGTRPGNALRDIYAEIPPSG
jgi:hypothetical protein